MIEFPITYEARKIFIKNGQIEIETPTIEEYKNRLEQLGLFQKGSKKGDINSVGA